MLENINTDEFLNEFVNKGQYTEFAKESHQTWKTAKENQGWTYAEERNNEAKTNPLLVDFENLPTAIKGQNLVTPYAVTNFFRVEAKEKNGQELYQMLENVANDKSNELELTQKMGEYIHTHFIAAQFPQGHTVEIRKDMIVYKALDVDTQSWDLYSGKEMCKFLMTKLKEVA